MFIDARQISDGSELDVDLCIVGAGAAGIAIAREFRGRNVRVALLESGGREADSATQELYAGANTGLPYFPLDACRVRQFGGTTNHWGGLCRPFDDTDFEGRDWVPGSAWPITRADLEPYYERAATIMRIPFAQDWTLAAWRARDDRPTLPLDPSRVETQFVQVLPHALRNFGTNHGAELEAADNIAVYLWANVTEIETDTSGGQATAVRVATLTGRRFRMTARRFVLATGALENVRLLLVSRAERPAGIGNEHDLVGRYFLEHPRFVAAAMVPGNPELDASFYATHHVSGTQLEGYLRLPRAIQRLQRIVETELRLGLDYDAGFESALNGSPVTAFRELSARRAPLGELGADVADVVADLMSWRHDVLAGGPLPVPYPELVGQLIRSTPAQTHALIPELLGDVMATAYLRLGGRVPLTAITVTPRIEPVPNRDSRVTLTEDRDALGMPRIALDWQLSQPDRHSAQRTLELFATEVGRASLGRVRITFDEAGTSWPQDLAGGFHQMGTTRMASRPEEGVVDADCRVHSVANLWIAGSSVFPTAGSGTPTFALVALAIRLADHIKATET